MNISKILIADNDILFLDLLEDILNEEGIEVQKARDGKEALEKLIEDPPDVLITDLIMPKVSGEQLIEYVSKDIYVVALSGALQEYKDIGNLKVDYYLHKADIESIRKGILQILDKIRKSEKRPLDPEEIPVEHYHPRTIVKELVADRNRREQIFQCLKEGLIIYDVDRRILWANYAACEIMEKSKNDLLNSRLEDHFDMILLDQVRQTAEEVGKESLGEALLKLSFGSKRLALHFSNLVEYGSPGNFEGILLVQDITQQCLAEESLTHERDYYSGIMDNLDEGVVVIDRSFNIKYANRFFEEFLDMESSEITGTNCHSLLFGYDRPCPGCKIQNENLFDEGNNCSSEMTVKNKKGESHIFKITGCPLEIIDGAINSFLLTFNDMTLLNRLKVYLEAESDLSDLFFSSKSIGQKVKEALKVVSKAAHASRGYWFSSQEGESGQHPLTLKAEWCAEGIPEQISKPQFRDLTLKKTAPVLYKELLKGEIISSPIDDLKEKDRLLFKSPGLESVVLVPLLAGSDFKGFLGFENCLHDTPWHDDKVNLFLSAANSILKALEKDNPLFKQDNSYSKYLEIYNNINDIWYLHDMEGEILEMNPAVKRVLGFESEELVSKKIGDIVFDNYKDGFDAYLKELKEKENSEGLIRVKNKAGEECILEYRSWLVQLPDGRTASRGVARNVTEKVSLESQLRQAQKMESLGTLAAGISHNFRNLLTGILTNSQIIQLKYKDDSELLRYSERINELSKMGADLISDLMQFGRKASVEAKVMINLSEVLNDTLNIISKSFDEDISINAKWPDYIPVYGDRSTLSQVFLNLCTNARDAMPDGGSLVIEAKIKDENIFITITDTGCGIDESSMGLIFDPFFTTKEHGNGTGLGLSTAYGIVKGHKGNIRVNSKVDKGTTFTIELPLASQES